jgi:hypothetical protein
MEVQMKQARRSKKDMKSTFRPRRVGRPRKSSRTAKLGKELKMQSSDESKRVVFDESDLAPVVAKISVDKKSVELAPKQDESQQQSKQNTSHGGKSA